MNGKIRKTMTTLLSSSLVMVTAVSSFAPYYTPLTVYAAESESEEADARNFYSFEEEMSEEELALYKAERSTERAHGGNWSIKVAEDKPRNPNDVPYWQYNQSKGSMHIIVENCKPNTTYTVTMYIWNETGGRLNAGLVDVEGNMDTPWNPGFVGGGRYDGISGASKDWQKVTRTITTGSRSDKFYIYAYCMNRKDGSDSGMFYVDDISVVEGETKDVEQTATIGYHETDERSFPDVLPAIQSFEAGEEGFFKLDPGYQVFSADEYSMDKAEYLAKSMQDKGIIDYYEIRTISADEAGEGIVLKKEAVDFELPADDGKIYSTNDTYQIDIEEDRVTVHADALEGIQNGAMTLLQAFIQRNQLPTGTVEDYTDQRYRGFQLDTARTFYPVDWVKEQMEQMAFYKQNKLQLRLKDSEGIRWDSDIAPELRDKDGYYYTRDEAQELAEFAKSLNIEIIPEVDYPGHSQMEIDMYKNAGKNDWIVGETESKTGHVLDVTNDEVRQYVIDMTAEAAEYFNATTVHIGGDEYFADTTSTATNELTSWAVENFGSNANAYDATTDFFNAVIDGLSDKGYNIFVWNDLLNKGKVVKLDKRANIDFWAGGWNGSYKGSSAAADGYNVMSSSSANYLNLWYQNAKESIRNPFPKEMYEQFTRYNYSVSSSSYRNDEILTENLDKSLGQMFPIWSDILGGVSEEVLTRALFPRYAVFSYITWGAQCDEKPMSYAELERLIFTLGSPRNELKSDAVINYNKADLDSVIAVIESGLEGETGAGAEALSAQIAEIQANPESFARDGWIYTDTIQDLIHAYENIHFTADEYVDAADKALLRSDIEAAENMDLTLYDEESTAAFNKALYNAKSTAANPNATQEQVDAARTALQTAIDELTYRKADYSAVETALKYVDRLKAENYLDFSAVTAAVNAVIYDLDITDQDQVDEMAKNIWDAVNALVPAFELGDKTALEELVAEVETVKLKFYTEESGAAFTAALEAAREVLDNPVAVQEELDEAMAALQTAFDALEVLPADYTAVNAMIARAESLTTDDYKNWDEVAAAIEAVEFGLSIMEQDRVDDMAAAIEDALDNLESKYGDKTYLSYALEQARDLDLEIYSEESVAALMAAIARAEEVMNDRYATQDECNDAEYALYTMDDLSLRRGDYSRIDELVAWVEAQNPDDYENFEDVTDFISWIYWDYDYTDQKIIDLTAQDLEDVIAGLIPVKAGNTTLLQAAVDYAKELDTTGVNEIVVEHLNDAIAEAEEILAKEKPAQTEINDAWKKLVNLIHMMNFTTDKTGLAALVEECQNINLNRYEDGETKDAFLAALEYAQSVLDDPTALTEVSIAKAMEELTSAKLALVPAAEIDTTLLEMVVNAGLEADLDAYLEDGKAEFSALLAQAQEMLKNPESQEQVDAMTMDLSNAWLALRLRPDEELLQTLNDFQVLFLSMDRSLFSADQLNELDLLNNKISAALEADQNGTRKLDQDAAKALADEADKAMKLIQDVTDKKTEDPAKPDQKPSETPVNPDQKPTESTTKPSVDQSTAPTTENSVKTSSSFMGSMWAAVTAASAGVFMALRRKKRD